MVAMGQVQAVQPARVGPPAAVARLPAQESPLRPLKIIARFVLGAVIRAKQGIQLEVADV